MQRGPPSFGCPKNPTTAAANRSGHQITATTSSRRQPPAIRAVRLSISQPIQRRPSRLHTAGIVPDPQYTLILLRGGV